MSNKNKWKTLMAIFFALLLILNHLNIFTDKVGYLILGGIIGVMFCLLDYYIRKIEKDDKFKKTGYRVLTTLLICAGLISISLELVENKLILAFIASFFFVKEAYEYIMGTE